MFQEFIKQHKRDHAAGEAEGGAAASNSELMETIITRELLLSQASARRSSELGDSTSLYRVPGAAAWPGLAAAGAKFKI